MSADGKKLAYVATTQGHGRCNTAALTVRDLADGTEKRWTWDPQYDSTSFRSLTWNRDATLLAFSYSGEGGGPVAVLDPNRPTGDIYTIARTVPLSDQEWSGGPTFTTRGLAINIFCCGTDAPTRGATPQKSELAFVDPKSLTITDRRAFPAEASGPPVADPTGQLMIYSDQSDALIRSAVDGTGRITLPRTGSVVAW